MKTSKARLSRRNFLLAVSAGTAAGAAAIVAKKEAVNGNSKDMSLESKKGYQLTEHVQNYYRTAKI
ncbi:MAG TPA: twin-arginine translocation signal domain-containing protein [Burkholderiales bacterium]|nr:twin-arginine translocation signal domain-containing protein [Burkholderiales bacterium]